MYYEYNKRKSTFMKYPRIQSFILIGFVIAEFVERTNTTAIA